MSRHHGIVLLAVALGLNLFFTSGCAYMKDRGNDAMDIVDLGITVNTRAKPQFALYADFFNLTPLGYSNLDGKVIGLGHRQFGVLDFTYDNWGVIAVGSERIGTGEFNPYDPRQARPDQADLTEAPRFDVGFIGSFTGEEPPPKRQFLECQRALHLGWIGIHATLRPVELIDFIVGWTTFSILRDDYRD